MSDVTPHATRPDGLVAPFTYDVVHDVWDWSDELFELHGYAVNEIPATLEALLHHKHPDDRDRVAGVFQSVIRDGGTYSSYHRIVDRNRRVLSVLSVGRAIPDAHGGTAQVQGYYVDFTTERRDETEAEVRSALLGSAQHGPLINQAKGMIMLAEGCADDEAFNRLRLSSQSANVKLHDVARQLVDVVSTSGFRAELVSEALDQVVHAARRGESNRTR